MKSVPFVIKAIVFDRLFLEITDLNVPFYNHVGRCLNFLEYALYIELHLKWDRALRSHSETQINLEIKVIKYTICL